MKHYTDFNCDSIPSFSCLFKVVAVQFAAYDISPGLHDDIKKGLRSSINELLETTLPTPPTGTDKNFIVPPFVIPKGLQSYLKQKMITALSEKLNTIYQLIQGYNFENKANYFKIICEDLGIYLHDVCTQFYTQSLIQIGFFCHCRIKS